MFYEFGHTIGRELCAELGVVRALLAAWDGRAPGKALKAIIRESAILAVQVPLKRRAVLLRGMRDGAAGRKKTYYKHPNTENHRRAAQRSCAKRAAIELTRQR